MPFTDDDWALLEHWCDNPRAAITGFLDRLGQCTSHRSGRDSEALDCDAGFFAALTALRESVNASCVAPAGAIDRFLFRGDHLIGAALRPAWKAFIASLVAADFSIEIEAFVDAMEPLEQWDRPIGDGPGRGATRAAETLSLPRLMRWWPYIRKALRGCGLVPASAILAFCQALEDHAEALKDKGLAAAKAKPATPFAEFRRGQLADPGPAIDGFQPIAMDLRLIRASVKELDHSSGDAEILDDLFDVMLATDELGRPRKGGALANRQRADRVRRVMRKLAEPYWFKGIKRAAWARRIAEDPQMQRVCETRGRKRSSPISWKTLQDYLAEDFNLADGQPRFVQIAED